MADPLTDLLTGLLGLSYALVFLVVLVLDIVFIFVILFLERDDPTRVLHWLMLLILLPFLGVFLFIFFHQDHRRKTRKFGQKASADFSMLIPEAPAAAQWSLRTAPSSGSDAWSEYRDLALLVTQGNPRSLVAGHNRVNLFVDGKEKFRSLYEDLRAAKDHIHLEYYIMRNDALAKELIEILAERAKAGVQVRLLLDGLGGRAIKKLEKRNPVLARSGVKVSYFYPRIGLSNYRNHRKIGVIDGKVGYCGGYNIGDEYLGKGPLGYWRDAAVRVVGPGSHMLQVRFLYDWAFASREKAPEDLGQYFQAVSQEAPAMMQNVSSGPDTPRESIKEAYIKMITMAKETCYIQTPYFVPDSSVLDALRVAAASGVDVRIMIPCKPDHAFVFWASQSFCADLLPAGVRSYKYNNGFIHAKTMVVDGKVSSVGSANFDVRSFRLNFETNVLVYDETIGAQMKEAFLSDLALCTEITRETYAKRGFVVKFKEPFCRLFFPIA